MPRKKINVGDTENLVLCYVFMKASKERDGDLYIRELYKDLDSTKTLIDIAVDALQKDGLCSRYDVDTHRFDPVGKVMSTRTHKCVRITKKGIEVVELWSNEMHDNFVRSIVTSANDSSYVEFLSTIETDSESITAQIPASDRYVNITHNQEYKETIRTLDAAIEQFKKDHIFDNEIGREKTTLTIALEAGRKLLEDTKIWLPTAINTLVEPLRRINSLYKKAAVQGTVASLVYSALEQVLKLLGFS